MKRLATPSDAAAVLEIYRPQIATSAATFETSPPTVADIAGRIESTLRHLPWLLDETDDGFVRGYAYASFHHDRCGYRWTVESSVYVHPDYTGRGIGRSLYQTLFAVLERQGFYTVQVNIALPNEASVRLHESMGFEMIGVCKKVGFKLGTWHDVSWWQLILKERVGTPAPPVALSQSLLQDALARLADQREFGAKKAKRAGEQLKRLDEELE